MEDDILDALELRCPGCDVPLLDRALVSGAFVLRCPNCKLVMV